MARPPKQLYDVAENGCWVWKGQYKQGEALITRDGKRRSAKRYYYELHHNVELDPDDRLRKHCGNQKCVSPEHHRIPTDEDRQLTLTKRWLYYLRWTLKNETYTKEQIEELKDGIIRRAYPFLRLNDIMLIEAITTCFTLARNFAPEHLVKWFNDEMNTLLKKKYAIIKEAPSK